jgi:hypothetical protein
VSSQVDSIDRSGPREMFARICAALPASSRRTVCASTLLARTAPNSSASVAWLSVWFSSVRSWSYSASVLSTAACAACSRSASPEFLAASSAFRAVARRSRVLLSRSRIAASRSRCSRVMGAASYGLARSRPGAAVRAEVFGVAPALWPRLKIGCRALARASAPARKV